jgi:hypothetical protein
VVRAPVPGAPRRLAEALLLGNTPDAFWSALRGWAALSTGSLTVAELSEWCRQEYTLAGSAETARFGAMPAAASEREVLSPSDAHG